MPIDWSPHPPLGLVEGVPYSTLFGDTFKSRNGPFEEAGAVFVGGCGLESSWRGLAPDSPFTILELGFGLGVNFLATLASWRASRPASSRLFYVAIEKHPVSAQDLGNALARLGAEPGLATALLERWPPPMAGLHRLLFDGDAVTLLLCIGDARHWLRRLNVAAQAVYLDGFSPASNAEMWEPATLKSVARLCARDARLATYSSAPGVRDALHEAGFAVDIRAGFGGKRRRIEAVYRPAWRTHAFAQRPPAHGREAVIVGAGLAGSATARELLRRNWSVTLVQDPRPGLTGSSQPVCVEHLHLSPDDNLMARLTRAAWQLSRSGAWLQALPRADVGRGKLVLLHDRATYERWLEAWPRLRLPATYAALLDRDQAIEAARWRPLAASPSLAGAIAFVDAASLDPRQLCAAWRDPETNARLRVVDDRVARIERCGEAWRAHAEDGRLLAQAPNVVLCNGAAARSVAPLASLPVQAFAGQTTRVTAHDRPAVSLSGLAYACPLPGQQMLIGATFEPLEGFEASSEADESNLARLAASAQTTPQALVASCGIEVLDRHPGVRCAPADHLPVIGEWPDEAAALGDRERLLGNAKLALPRLPGLHANFAYGARGLLWCVLGAEFLAAQLNGEPLPLSNDHAAAIDPARALRRWLRRAVPR